MFYCGDENKDPQVKKYMTTKYMEALDMANLSRLMANLNLPPFVSTKIACALFPNQKYIDRFILIPMLWV